MKKIIALWVFMLSMIFSGSCFAEDFVYHQYDDGTAYVFSYEGTSEYVRIPSEYNGCKVTRIGTRALCLPWETDNKVQEVEIEPGIEVIGASAFRNMSNLISVSLPDTIKIIENHAFFNCTSLSKIELPEGLTEIQFGAFEKCTSLEEITIPDSVEIIEGRAFYGCTNLKEIHIGDRDIIIRGKAFAETAWDDNTTGYGILGKTLVSCHQNRSQGTVPEGITGIADNAFEDDIKRLHISPDVKWIGSGILTEIESFTGGENLERVYASASLDWNYKLPSRDTPLIIGHVFLRYTGDAESVTIPEGVTCIASVAFAGSSVKEVIIPESVEYIGDQVFVKAANLKSVNIPKMVKEIGENPF